MSKRVLFICNESINVVNFRSELINYLSDHDYIVDVLCADYRRIEDIKKTGVNSVHVVPFTNRGTNPLSLIKLEKQFIKVIKSVNPDIVFTFQAKPNIVGAKAAYKCHIKNIVSMVEGLGNPFQPSNFKGKVLRFVVSNLYKKSLKHNKLIIFLNEDDKQEFIKRKIAKDEQAIVIPGIGIDTHKVLKVNEIPKDKRVMMLPRLTANKGVIEYCEIASLVRKQRKDIIFELYGDEQDIVAKDLADYIDAGDINYYGYTNDPIGTIAKCRIYVSTSFYREGFPRTLLEAMALGKAIVATDTIGSKDAIKDGVNGYQLHMHDVDGFVKKIIELIDDEKELKRIGDSARMYCEEHYDSNEINAIILDKLNNL